MLIIGKERFVSLTVLFEVTMNWDSLPKVLKASCKWHDLIVFGLTIFLFAQFTPPG